jgi:hypothetical protein
MLARDALVIELLSARPVGRGAQGKKKVCQYLKGLSESISARAACAPSAHLSEKYGLAAWLPMENGGAIHLYAWDDRTPSFISVDILGFTPIDEQGAISFTRDFYGVSDDESLVYRRTFGRLSRWRELAPEIYRQRLLLSAPGCEPPSRASVARFLPALSIALGMKPLSAKVVDKHAAWMHWETSGCVYHWQEEALTVDIYTCKRFAPQRAASFVQEFFGLPRLLAFGY